MTMKFWSSPTSPYVRKIRILIIEKGLQNAIEEEQVKTNAFDSHAGLLAANPLARIPALMLEDGENIFDSRVIARYLDDQGEGMSLHPPYNVRHETLIALADGILDSAVSAAYERLLRPEDKQFEPWIDAQWDKMRRGVEEIERRFMDYLEGINMGSIGVLCALEYLDFRHGDRDWRQYAAKLAAWHAGVKDRPSFAATRPA